MPLIKELDSSMTIYLQLDKKKKLNAIAAEKRQSGSAFLLTIVDQWLEEYERQNGSIPNATQD